MESPRLNNITKNQIPVFFMFYYYGCGWAVYNKYITYYVGGDVSWG